MGEFEDACEKTEAFLGLLEQRGRRELTIATYRSYLGRFVRFLDENGRHCDPSIIGEDEIRYFIENYDACENTKKCYVSLVRMVMETYGNNNLGRVRFMWNVNDHPHAKWISEADFRRMLENVDGPTERLILLLGARCGLRRGEMERLKMSDYDGRILRIIGKGHGKGKIRIVPVSEQMRREIDLYIVERKRMIEGRVLRNDNSLLVLPVGDRFVNDFKANLIRRRVSRIAARTGVACTPHSLRRLFATSLIENGVEITVVSKLMGHNDINTTMKYIRRNENVLRSAVETLPV